MTRKPTVPFSSLSGTLSREYDIFTSWIMAYTFLVLYFDISRCQFLGLDNF